MTPPIAVVIGALGAQGSSVVSSLLSSGGYRIRALTSTPSSPDAIDLSADPAVDVIEIDLLSIDSLVSAFRDATYIFANSVFRPDVFMEKGARAAQELEETHGLNIVRAARKVARDEGTLEHLVWSTLPDAEKISGGKYTIPHFQSKIPAEEYLLDEGNGLKERTTFLRVGMYGLNLERVPYLPVYVNGTNKHIVTLPCSSSAVIPMVGAVTPNVGLIVDAIFRQREKSRGKYVLGVAEHLTAKEWALALSKVSGKDVVFLETSLGAYEELWGAVGTEIGLMMKYIEELGRQCFTAGVDSDMLLTPADLGVEDVLHSTEDALRNLAWDKVMVMAQE
ncbi:uncharacterized protein BDV17DRAFT_290261 [Aspergillus undulatus]|uniref:uncharacterized protein n=1 Tax=Aspergillus undulatus TaxID=1810928 RepID=UPI003CCCF7FD